MTHKVVRDESAECRLDNLIKGTFIWFSLCVIVAFIRFFAHEAKVLFPRLR